MEKRTVDTSAAEAYEQCMVPAFLGAWAARAVGYAEPRAGEAVLDVACGTGTGARAAAALVGPAGSVVGVDVDPAMVEVAKRLASEAAAPTEWHCASALQMPLPDAAFDLCLCLQGLQFFPDRRAALAEIHRVLKPSGRLVATVWASLESVPAYDALIRALERQNIDTAAIRKGFSFGDPEAIRQAARDAGFGTIEIRTEDGHGGCASVKAYTEMMAAGSTTARAALAKLSDTGRGQLLADMTQMLAPYVGAEFKWPMRARVVFARP